MAMIASNRPRADQRCSELMKYGPGKLPGVLQKGTDTTHERIISRWVRGFLSATRQARLATRWRFTPKSERPYTLREYTISLLLSASAFVTCTMIRSGKLNSALRAT